MAQWKRAGPITQRSVDRNHALLTFLLFFDWNTCFGCFIQVSLLCIAVVITFQLKKVVLVAESVGLVPGIYNTRNNVFWLLCWWHSYLSACLPDTTPQYLLVCLYASHVVCLLERPVDCAFGKSVQITTFNAKSIKMRFWRGSNSWPSACKADVITTTPQNLPQFGKSVGNVFFARSVWSKKESKNPPPTGLEPAIPG